MARHPRHWVRTLTCVALAATTALTVGLAQAPTAGAAPDADRGTSGGGLLGDSAPGLDDLDLRGSVAPTAAQLARASALGRGVSVRWNSFGTPATIAPASGLPGRGHR